MTDTFDAISRDIEADAHHWRRLAIQENREGNTEAAAAYEICAGQLDEYVTKLTALSNQGEGAVRDREADRRQFPDEAFNRWLDEGISDAGHTVWCQVVSICDAWHGWNTRPYYDGSAEADRRDAERYRFLRDQNATLESPDAWTITRCDFTDEEGPDRYWVGADLDAAIDAATQEQT